MNLDDLNRKIINCRKCPRLVEWREKVADEKRFAYRNWDYWGKPVPGFGDSRAQVFLIGLAPGAHGSNRTGRQFTGDSSGDFLFPALYKAGFASQSFANSREDGLVLKGLYTAPVCRCVPPGNKPTIVEIDNCREYLRDEIRIIHPRIFVALGRIAFDSIHTTLQGIYPTIDYSSSKFKFFHGAQYNFWDGCWLICSYHPSRQNTQTGRLTENMFDRIWQIVRELLDAS